MAEDKIYDFKVTPEMERGRRIYEETIKPRHGDAIDGLIVIDVDSGEYVMNSIHHLAVDEFRARHPKGERVFVHDGRVYPGHLGGLGTVLWLGLTEEEKDAVPRYDHHNGERCDCGVPERSSSVEER